MLANLRNLAIAETRAVTDALACLTGRVTVSLGVAAIPEHASDGDSLLRAADRALYSAKNSGRNQVCVPADFDRSGLQEIPHGGPASGPHRPRPQRPLTTESRPPRPRAPPQIHR